MVHIAALMIPMLVVILLGAFLISRRNRPAPRTPSDEGAQMDRLLAGLQRMETRADNLETILDTRYAGHPRTEEI